MKFILGEALQRKYFTEDIDEINAPVEEAGAEEIIEENPTQIVEEPEGQDCIATTAEQVMDAYQKANKWLDIVKETLYTDMGCVFFSSCVHALAHTMPERFDKFGDILHTVNRKIPYPATEWIPNEPTNMDEVFDAIFMCLDNIKDSLNAFIKCTDENNHGMSCAAEELLNDIEAEYPMLFRLKQEWDQCSGDNIKFDKYVNQYVRNRSDLVEALNPTDNISEDQLIYGFLIALYKNIAAIDSTTENDKMAQKLMLTATDEKFILGMASKLIATKTLSEPQKNKIKDILAKYARRLMGQIKKSKEEDTNHE